MNAGRELRLYFVEIRLPWYRLDWILYGMVAGTPHHIDTAVDGLVYMIGPGRRGCAQLTVQEYESARPPGRKIVATATLPALDHRRAKVAADTYAVGPMTRRGAVLRSVTGKPDILDVDCVAAAAIVLGAAGYPMKCPRTAKGMLECLRKKHPSSVSVASRQSSP